MSLKQMMANELPLNRKERYFTGTIFPMVVCRDNFRHFQLFLELIGIKMNVPISIEPDQTNIQFFTEYSLVESIIGSATQRFPNPPKAKDTPDILILINCVPKILIALEAKLYAATSENALENQMCRQETILHCIENGLGIEKKDVYFSALLPEKMAHDFREFKYPILTWEKLYDVYYKVCGEDYWLAILRIALESYKDLASKGAFYRRNCEKIMCGLDIYHGYKDGTIDQQIMGRKGGLTGDKIKKDLVSGKWRSQDYGTNSNTTPINRNWFLIREFVEHVDKVDSHNDKV